MADVKGVNSSFVLESHRLAQAAAGGRVNLTLSAETAPHIQLLGSAMRLERVLYRYVTPALILLGNISNLLAIIVLCRRTLRRHSHCFLLAAYAFTNLLVLNFVIGAQWISKIMDWPHVSDVTTWSCGLWAFLHNVLAYSGVWLMVTVSTDRCVWALSPRRAATMCTVFTARALTALIVLALVVISVHALWIYEPQMHGCFIRERRDAFYTLLWSKVSNSLYSYIPLTLLLPLNVILAVAAVRKCGVGGKCGGGRDANRRPVRSSPRPPNFLVATLTVSSLHFLLVVPNVVAILVDTHLPTSKLSLGVVMEIEMAKVVTSLLSRVNHVLPGLVLLAASPAFRTECWDVGWDLVERCCRPRRKTYEMHTLNGKGAPTGGASSPNATTITASGCGRSTIEENASSRGRYQACHAEMTQVSEL